MTAAGGRADQRGQEYMMPLLNMGTREVRNQTNNPTPSFTPSANFIATRAGVSRQQRAYAVFGGHVVLGDLI